MALNRGKDPTAAPQRKTRMVPRPPVIPQRELSLTADEDRFEKGLSRRWEQAWNRARSGGR